MSKPQISVLKETSQSLFKVKPINTSLHEPNMKKAIHYKFVTYGFHLQKTISTFFTL